jgi:hypothetical protein
MFTDDTKIKDDKLKQVKSFKKTIVCKQSKLALCTVF